MKARLIAAAVFLLASYPRGVWPLFLQPTASNRTVDTPSQGTSLDVHTSACMSRPLLPDLDDIFNATTISSLPSGLIERRSAPFNGTPIETVDQASNRKKRRRIWCADFDDSSTHKLISGIIKPDTSWQTEYTLRWTCKQNVIIYEFFRYYPGSLAWNRKTVSPPGGSSFGEWKFPGNEYNRFEYMFELLVPDLPPEVENSGRIDLIETKESEDSAEV